MRVMTISAKLLNRNMISYKVAPAEKIPIYNFDNNKFVNTPFVLFRQSDQILSCYWSRTFAGLELLRWFKIVIL